MGKSKTANCGWRKSPHDVIATRVRTTDSAKPQTSQVIVPRQEEVQIRVQQSVLEAEKFRASRGSYTR